MDENHDIGGNGQVACDGHVVKQEKNGPQHHIDQWSGYHGPKHGWSFPWRLTEGNAAKGPEDDGVGGTADGAAGQLMTKFMGEHDSEKTQNNKEVPYRVGEIGPGRLVIDVNDNQPTPMDEHIDAEEAKNP